MRLAYFYNLAIYFILCNDWTFKTLKIDRWFIKNNIHNNTNNLFVIQNDIEYYKITSYASIKIS